MSVGQVEGSYLFLLHWLMKQHSLFFFVLLTLILADGLCTDVLTDDASNPSLQDGA